MKVKSIEHGFTTSALDVMEMHVKLKPEVGYEVDHDTGALTLKFKARQGEEFPAGLTVAQIEWCERHNVNPDVVLDGLYHAVHNEQMVVLFRQAMES